MWSQFRGFPEYKFIVLELWDGGTFCPFVGGEWVQYKIEITKRTTHVITHPIMTYCISAIMQCKSLTDQINRNVLCLLPSLCQVHFITKYYQMQIHMKQI